MVKVNTTKIVIAGVVYATVAQAIHTIGTMLTMGFYLDPVYFKVWSKIMMPEAGPPPASFFYYAITFGVVTGILLAYVYSLVREGIPGKGIMKGVNYGAILYLAAGLPMTMTLYLLINLPAMLILDWSLEALVIYLVNGIIFARLI